MSNLIERFVVEAPGSIQGYIEFVPGICRCGDVVDGVGIALVNGPEAHGAGFVVAFKDIEKLYLLAKAAREPSRDYHAMTRKPPSKFSQEIAA